MLRTGSSHLAPSHITPNSTFNSGLDQTIPGQTVSNENPVSSDGFYGAPNSIFHVAHATGRMMRTAYDWLTSLARTVEGADPLLFPGAAAAPVPFFQTHGNIMRTFEMPPELESHPEVMRLLDPNRKPDLSTEFHQGIARKLKTTFDEMFKAAPVVKGSRIAMVSDLHETGRCYLTVRHLMLMASREELMVLLDGLPRGGEEKRLQAAFRERLSPGLLRGLENEFSLTLSRFMRLHPKFLELQSMPASATDKEKMFISQIFNSIAVVWSNAIQKVYSDYNNLTLQEEKAPILPILPFTHAALSRAPGAKSKGDHLTEWYVGGSEKDRKSVTLFLGRVISDIAKSLDKTYAEPIASYLKDPKSKKAEAQAKEVITSLRRQHWKEVFEAALKENEDRYKKTGRETRVMVFVGKNHEEEITDLLSESLQKAGKPEEGMKKKGGKSKEEMKSEL